MTKAPRTDKKKNIGKVAVVLAEDPHATEREIAEKVGLGNGTVNRAKKELEQTGAKDKEIAYIVGSSKKRIGRISKLLNRYVEEVEEKKKLDRRDIGLVKDIAKDDMARVTVFGGDITDDEGGFNIGGLLEKLQDVE